MSTAASAEEAARTLSEAEVVLSAAAVSAAYERLADSIQDAMGSHRPVVLACMVGGLIPTVELIKRIRVPVELDYVHATRYRQGTSGHEVEWRVPPPERVRGRQVLVVDDILDEGHTLAAILAAVRDAGAAGVRSAVLVEKLHARRAPGLTADFVGGSVPDRYVFGCGMDYKGWHRQLPAIYAVAVDPGRPVVSGAAQPGGALAIIGGTGLTALEGLSITRREVVHTPWGEPSGPVTHGTLNGRAVAFLARHGYRHTIPPHQVNYRANVWALREAGAVEIVAVAAVGGIRADLAAGGLLIPDQIVDYTWGRGHTFFEGGPDRVVHVDFTEPYDAGLRRRLLAAAARAGVATSDGGTYGVTQGPRLESAAEIDRMQRDGCDVVGMTGMPEAALARELDLAYAHCAVVANPAAGRGSGAITMEDIRARLEVGMAQVRRLLHGLLEED